MTKEDAISILQQVVDWRHDSLRGHPGMRYIAEAVEIILSKPSLPSNLDEAAEKVRSRVKEIFDSLPKYDIDEERHNRVEFSLIALEAFAQLFYQAGAEWMAGQWVSKERNNNKKTL